MSFILVLLPSNKQTNIQTKNVNGQKNTHQTTWPIHNSLFLVSIRNNPNWSFTFLRKNGSSQTFALLLEGDTTCTLEKRYLVKQEMVRQLKIYTFSIVDYTQQCRILYGLVVLTWDLWARWGRMRGRWRNSRGRACLSLAARLPVQRSRKKANMYIISLFLSIYTYIYILSLRTYIIRPNPIVHLPHRSNLRSVWRQRQILLDRPECTSTNISINLLTIQIVHIEQKELEI